MITANPILKVSVEICQILGLITECDEQLNGEGHGFHHKLTDMNTAKVIQMEVPPLHPYTHPNTHPHTHTHMHKEIEHVTGIKGIVLCCSDHF